jgi:CHAD domain-containing protein
MAETKREIERKYEATGESRLPDLTRAAGVSSVADRGVVALDAVYYDTSALHLASHAITLRRRTGGEDAGWHLKLPVAPGVRDEVREPLGDTPDAEPGTDAVPHALADLVRARTLGAPLQPVVRMRSSRALRHLLDADGELLAEVSIDTVDAERPAGGPGATWTEIEVELADGGDPAVLDAVEKRLRKAGIRPASSPSKLARALQETGPPTPQPPPAGPTGDSAGEQVLAHLRTQVEALLAHDPAVRRDLPDSVHQMRVATRRLRSAFKTYRKVLDRTVTDPLGDELKWLAGELGVDRDQEVLAARLRARLDALPPTLLLGPVHGRLQIWSVTRGSDSRRRTLAVLDSPRYLGLLAALQALLADPPLRRAAQKKAAEVMTQALAKDRARFAGRVEHALALTPGTERDAALHDARKAAKRLRYAAESARPVLGGSANRLRKRVKAVQSLLGDHQDSVVARAELRNLAVHAHGAGESAFVWGLLYGQEQAAGAERERELSQAWERVPRV